jgi:hypothetical protein
LVALRVQLSHGFVRGQPPHREVWLLIEWPESGKEPSKYFLWDLPATYRLPRFVRLAKCRWKIEQDYQQLKQELGLDHYEARSWMGWHYHARLVMCAQAFLTLEILRGKKPLAGPCHRRVVKFNIYLLFTWTGFWAYCGANANRPRVA